MVALCCLCAVLLTEPRVGLGIGACCLALENSPPGIYIHSLAPGSVAKMESNLRLVTSLALENPGVVLKLISAYTNTDRET
jgi:hypothetical protein